MKVKVLKTFVDRDNLLRQYTPGELLDWKDQDRIDKAAKSGLVELLEQPPVVKKAGKKE